MNEPEHVLAVQDEVGEAPIWIPDEGALYWIDIEGKRVHRYEPATKARQDWNLDVPITALARRAGRRWIIAAKDGLHFWDQENNTSEFIVDPEADNPACRFNDSAVDRQGRLLIGTINQQDLNAPDGCLYRLDPDLSIHKLDDGYAVANGIGYLENHIDISLSAHDKVLFYRNDRDAMAKLKAMEFAGADWENNVVYDAWGMGVQVGSDGFFACFHPLLKTATPETAEHMPPDFNREGMVRDSIRLLGKGGGHIIGPSQEVMNDVPLANAAALLT